VLNISKIQFKSNSQLSTAGSNIKVGCAQYFKPARHSLGKLAGQAGIQFKSNSQQPCPFSAGFMCCAQYFKDTIQKQFTTLRSPVQKQL